MDFKRGKKAQGLSINAIILIVLGILVLVMLVLGFTMGWDKIMPWINPPNNVQDVVSACQLKCSQNAKFSFCSELRTISMNQETAESLGLSTRKLKKSCVDLAEDYTNLGIEACAGLCDLRCIKYKETDPTNPGTITKIGALCVKPSDYATNTPADEISGTFRDTNITHYCQGFANPSEALAARCIIA